MSNTLQSQNVSPLFLEDSVHGGIVVHNHVVLEVSLRGAQAELDKAYFGVFNAAGTACEMAHFLVNEDQAIDQF
jgi:hypothetical protein